MYECVHVVFPQELCDILMQYFTTSSQVKLYRSTVVALLNSPYCTIDSIKNAQEVIYKCMVYVLV